MATAARVLALFVLCLLWWCSSGRTVQVIQDAPGPLPDAPVRRASPPQTAGRDGEAEPTVSQERLRIWITNPYKLHYVLEVRSPSLSDLVPSSPWEWDLATLEASPFFDTWQYSAAEPYAVMQQYLDLREASLEVAPSVDSPEDAWVSLYASWVDAWFSRKEAFDDYVERHLGPELAWHEATPTERRDAVRAESLPLIDTRQMERLANETLTRFPDHPVADHARLIQTLAAHPKYQRGAAVGTDWLEHLQSIENDDLARFALLDMMETSGSSKLEPEVLDALLAFEDLDVIDEVRVVSAVARHAARAGDIERGILAERRLRAGLDAYCAASLEYGCTARTLLLTDLSARLAAAAGTRPATWQEALTAEAWSCEFDQHPHSGISRTTATWDGTSWSWGTWDVETEGTACLSQVVDVAPPPPEPLQVEVVYEYSR